MLRPTRIDTRMQFPASLARCAFILNAACLVVICAPGPVRAQCPDYGEVVFNDVAAVEGKPFQAKEMMTLVTYGSDGAKRVQVTKANLFRDSKGRIRVERFYDGTEHPPETVATQIMIYDNCGTSVSLQPVRQTAKISRDMAPQKGTHPPYCQEIDPNNPPQPGREGKFEDLGHKVIDSVDVRGARQSYYDSVDAKRSGAPPVRVYENWCSEELDTPMDSFVLSDKPKQEIATAISEVKLVDSDSTLFEVPEGYAITQANQSTPPSNSNGGQSENPNFRIEIQAGAQGGPKFTVTNLSDKSVSACVLEISIASQGKGQSKIVWDAPLLGERPLDPGASISENLVHQVGAPLPDKVEVIAGIWSDGEPFGQPDWVKNILATRVDEASKLQQATSFLQRGLDQNWTRKQYLNGLSSMSDAGTGIRSTLEADRDLGNQPAALQQVIRTLLENLDQKLELLQQAKSPTNGSSAP